MLIMVFVFKARVRLECFAGCFVGCWVVILHRRRLHPYKEKNALTFILGLLESNFSSVYVAIFP